MAAQTTLLASAVARQQWELVALYLLVGALAALERVPADALPALLELVGDSRG